MGKVPFHLSDWKREATTSSGAHPSDQGLDKCHDVTKEDNASSSTPNRVSTKEKMSHQPDKDNQ